MPTPDLLARWAAGDEAAGRELLARHQGMVTATVAGHPPPPWTRPAADPARPEGPEGASAAPGLGIIMEWILGRGQWPTTRPHFRQHLPVSRVDPLDPPSPLFKDQVRPAES